MRQLSVQRSRVAHSAWQIIITDQPRVGAGGVRTSQQVLLVGHVPRGLVLAAHVHKQVALSLRFGGGGGGDEGEEALGREVLPAQPNAGWTP